MNMSLSSFTESTWKAFVASLQVNASDLPTYLSRAILRPWLSQCNFGKLVEARYAYS